MPRGLRPRDLRFDPGVYLDRGGDLVVDTRPGAPTPPRAPARDYFSRWPHRYLRWEPKRELWEVRQRNPETGQDERYELVFWLVEGEGEPEEPPTRQRHAQLMRRLKAGDGRLRKIYRPFDYRFVGPRIEQSREFRAKGAERTTRDRKRRNREQRQKNREDAAYEVAAGFEELYRWLPVIESIQKTGEFHPHERIPQVRGADHEEE